MAEFEREKMGKQLGRQWWDPVRVRGTSGEEKVTVAVEELASLKKKQEKL